VPATHKEPTAATSAKQQEWEICLGYRAKGGSFAARTPKAGSARNMSEPQSRKVDSYTKITATVPTGAKTGKIGVTTPGGETVTVSAADPLNLLGIIAPGERMPAILGRSITLRDGYRLTNHAATRCVPGGRHVKLYPRR
jgi:hypothetical protein